MPRLMGLTREQDEQAKAADKVGLGRAFRIFLLLRRYGPVLREAFEFAEALKEILEGDAIMNENNEKCLAAGCPERLMGAGLDAGTLWAVYEFLQAHKDELAAAGTEIWTAVEAIYKIIRPQG